MPRRIAVLLALVAAVAGACNDAERDADGQVQTSGDLSVYELRTGDCFNGGQRVAEEVGKERTVDQVTAVPCGQAHDNEVFAVFDHPAAKDADFPGEEAVNQVAQDGCLERFEAYVGRPYAGSDLQVAVIAPAEKSWTEEDDRAIVCIVYGDGRLTGSQKAVPR
ncbi:MAG: septum formation family protein [Acidimicrobiia bacterium]